MTPERLSEIRALIERPTPGPWMYRFDTANGGVTARIYSHEGEVAYIQAGWNAIVDGPLIAVARTAVPELLEEIERLRSLLVRFRDLYDLTAHYPQSIWTEGEPENIWDSLWADVIRAVGELKGPEDAKEAE